MSRSPLVPRAALRSLVREERGTATVELVILLPFVFYFMVNAIEASILMTRVTLLDRGLDLAVRELRLNTDEPPTYEEFRALICSRSGHIPSCGDTLIVELRPVDPGEGSALAGDALCAATPGDIVPHNEADPDHYATGGAGEPMIVRACLVVEPIVPNFGLAALLQNQGAGFQLVSASAFVYEPAISRAGT